MQQILMFVVLKVLYRTAAFYSSRTLTLHGIDVMVCLVTPMR